MAASTLCPTLAQESVRVLRRRGVETVILAGADTHGIMRGKRVPIAELDRAAERGIALCDVIWALPVDEVEPVQPPPGHDGWFPRAGYPDMLADARPRDGPHRSRGTTARRCCCATSSIATAAPSRCRRAPSCARWSIAPGPWASSRSSGSSSSSTRCARRRSRCCAKRPSQLEAVEERPSVYGVVAASRHEDFAGAVRATLQEYGLAVEACAPEAGPGQFEINVRAAPALQAADEAFLLKSAVKEIAARHGLLATFMAKPRSDWPGSSCHLHLSLRDGTPAAMRHFIGGLLDGMAELTAIFAPTPNSYRRLHPVLVGGHDRHVERRQPLRRRPGDLRRRRHRPRRAPPGRRRRQPVPRGRGGARRGARRRAARVRAAAARRRRRLRAGRRRRARAPRVAGRGHRPARAQRAGPRLAGRRRRRPLRGDAARGARGAVRRGHRLGDRALPGGARR